MLLTSRRQAAALGVPDEKLVYLHGSADAQERGVLDRNDLSGSPAAAAAVHAALSAVTRSIEDIDFLDLYSCFPIAVFNICDAFDIAMDGQTPLTVTGGLPYFGGAGSNYTMHAIASMVRVLRERPKACGLIGANGGFMSKYSVGIYAAEPGWSPPASATLQADLDRWPPPSVDFTLSGDMSIETYTIDYLREPPHAIVIGRSATGVRTVGSTSNPEIVAAMIAKDPNGGAGTLAPRGDGLMTIAAFRPGARGEGT